MTNLRPILNIFEKSEKDDIYKGINKFEVLSSKDVSAIQNYNKLISQGTSHTYAFSKSMSEAGVTAQTMANNANGTAISLEKMSIGEKLAAKGLGILKSAGNLLLNLGLTAAISLVIAGINEVIHKEDIAKQKLDELSQKTKEKAKTDLTDVENLRESIKAYQELGQKTSLTADEKDKSIAIAKDLTDKYGIEAKNIDLVNGKYKEQNDELEKILINKAKAAITSNKTSYDVAKSKENKFQNKEELFLN